MNFMLECQAESSMQKPRVEGEIAMANDSNPVQKFNELVRLGHVTPRSDYADLSMPSLYRAVHSVTTSGTESIAVTGSSVPPDAELGRSNEGDQ
jgi:hypothetical protein